MSALRPSKSDRMGQAERQPTIFGNITLTYVAFSYSGAALHYMANNPAISVFFEYYYLANGDLSQ